MDEPLIYTSRGNVPLSSVTQSVSWEDHPNVTLCIEEYRAADGEVVKRSVHGLAKTGLGAIGQQATI
jgi:hypothetical protein